MRLVSINPATGRKLASYRGHSAKEIDQRLERAHKTQRAWRETTLPARAKLLRALAKTARAGLEKLALLAVHEMGKPLTQARGEVEKCASLCDYYAAQGPAMLADQVPPAAPKGGRVTFDPLGVVLAIMPWNFPYWQVFRAAVPALLAGNTVVLKHSANVGGCSIALEKLFLDAGFPPGAFQSLLIGSDPIAKLVADPRICGVTLTGSTSAGKKVAELAGAAMKPTVFELGGSDAFLVLKDADVPRAAEIAAQARLINNGQSCVCAKRFIVVKEVRKEFERRFCACLEARRVGDPSDVATEVGPLARGDLRDQLHAQVQASEQRGARVLLGGKLPDGPGFYYPPTALTDVAPGMPAYDEELFGPVAAIIRVRDEAEAVRVANDSIYGLGAAVFTGSQTTARRVAKQLEAGAVFVNALVASHPALPFGGVKQSGHGRELALWGLQSFMNVKTVVESFD